MTRPIVPPESAVLKTCLAILRARGVFCWRSNVGAFAGEYKGKQRFVRYGMPGSLDILGCLCDGRFLAVEAKREGERPTPKQIAFMQAVNKSKGVAFWVDSPRILEAILDWVMRGASVHVDDDGHITVETCPGRPSGM